MTLLVVCWRRRRHGWLTAPPFFRQCKRLFLKCLGLILFLCLVCVSSVDALVLFALSLLSFFMSVLFSPFSVSLSCLLSFVCALPSGVVRLLAEQVHELEAEMDSLNKPHSQFSQVRGGDMVYFDFGGRRVPCIFPNATANLLLGVAVA